MQRDILLLTEMIDAAEQAHQLTAGITIGQLDTDRQRRDALLWNFTVLGEAAGQLSAEVKDPAGTDGSFGTLKQVDAGVLSVGYAEAGPGDGPAVILLHGWPYDIHSYADVTPLLASAGYRVIVPYLRGYGTTRSSPMRRCAMASNRSSGSTSSRSWTLSASPTRSSAGSTGGRGEAPQGPPTRRCIVLRDGIMNLRA